MKGIKVGDLMVPLEEYATVNEEASLYEAILALEETHQKYDQRLYKHRAILVFNKDNRIVGKLSQLDVIRGLEPRYAEIGDLRTVSRFGYRPEFIRSMLKNYRLWQKPLDNICRKASQMKVKDIMYTPTEGEYVQEEASLDEAIHQLIIGHHQSLLVMKGKAIVGILRLVDVFKKISDIIKTCQF